MSDVSPVEDPLYVWAILLPSLHHAILLAFLLNIPHHLSTNSLPCPVQVIGPIAMLTLYNRHRSSAPNDPQRKVRQAFCLCSILGFNLHPRGFWSFLIAGFCLQIAQRCGLAVVILEA
ncbi:hypothetical protein P154DRAFT_248891 [Amniculicola lignicola CBS 123094]|uniref:Uncharacterized protein n=1 Tax=Amniculicola lignicola CBS 123094 TaxID=1392246 RepID=A0A6A5WCC1_9PLEO|nr:hypothetical protein P154DRAFT_248891 [Amniculicola lignicola CBS 123094]